MSSGAMMSLTLETALETPWNDVSCGPRLNDLDTDPFRHRRSCPHLEAQQLHEYQLMLLMEQQPGNGLEFGKRSEHQNDGDSIISHTFWGMNINLNGWVAARIENLPNTTPQSTQIHNKILRFCYLACADFGDGHDGKMMKMFTFRSLGLGYWFPRWSYRPKLAQFIYFATIRNGLRKAVGHCMEWHVYGKIVNESPQLSFEVGMKAKLGRTNADISNICCNEAPEESMQPKSCLAK